jgi:hypothetical protein
MASTLATVHMEDLARDEAGAFEVERRQPHARKHHATGGQSEGLPHRSLLPGVNTSPSDFASIRQLQLQRFKGERWELFRDVISGDVGG